MIDGSRRSVTAGRFLVFAGAAAARLQSPIPTSISPAASGAEIEILGGKIVPEAVFVP
jgi:hypothetical protein